VSSRRHREHQNPINLACLLVTSSDDKSFPDELCLLDCYKNDGASICTPAGVFRRRSTIRRVKVFGCKGGENLIEFSRPVQKDVECRADHTVDINCSFCATIYLKCRLVSRQAELILILNTNK